MKEIKAFAAVIQNLFDIGDWDLQITRTEKGDGADVSIDHRYKRISMRFHPNFFTQDPKEQASAIIHEFCHMFNVPMYSLLRIQWSDKIVTKEHADDILEQCNTRAETVLVRLLTDKTLKKAHAEYIKRRSPKRPDANRKSSRRKKRKVPANRDKKVQPKRK